ncbi:MAG: hypothetical protein ACK41S_11165 [Planctomycetota bacterium]
MIGSQSRFGCNEILCELPKDRTTDITEYQLPGAWHLQRAALAGMLANTG